VYPINIERRYRLINIERNYIIRRLGGPPGAGRYSTVHSECLANEESNQLPPSDDQQRAAMRAAAKRIDRVTDWLRVGGALPPEEYERLREAGIDHVVDLREEGGAEPARLKELGILQRHVPVPNQSPPTIEQLGDVANWLSEQPRATVYVHCQGGFGRAATMAIGLLVFHGTALDDAVEQVRKVRPEIRLNAKQMAWLRSVALQRSRSVPK
jgi:protein-tyrosine phosphatase